MKTRWQFWAALVLTIGAVVAVKAQAPTKPSYIAEINVFGDIAPEMAIHISGQIIAACTADGSDPILLVIDSDGGDIVAGSTIIDAMQQCHHPVHTLCIGAAQSMGFLIFEYGEHREMWPRSFLMWHNAHMVAHGSPAQIRALMAMWGPKIAEYEIFIAARAGITLDQEHAKQNDVWYMSADDAIAAHLVDEITAPARH